jgi:hypothetical protein
MGSPRRFLPRDALVLVLLALLCRGSSQFFLPLGGISTGCLAPCTCLRGHSNCQLWARKTEGDGRNTGDGKQWIASPVTGVPP